MDFDLTDEQQATVEAAAGLLADKSTPERLRAVEQQTDDRFDRELWSAMADAGLLGLVVPESAGGAGLGVVEACLVLEEVGRRTAAVPALSTIAGALVLGEAGATDLLGDVAAGAHVLGLALVDEGGDPFEPTATATEADGAWTITGSKTNVVGGWVADTLLVTATTPDGIGLFAVAAAADGVERTRQDTTTGVPEASVVLDGAAGDPIGALDGSTATRLVEVATVGACAVMTGVCDEAIRITGTYTVEREQFGRAIATFQAVGQRAADAFVDTQAVRLTMLQAAWHLSARPDASKEVAVAKYWAALGGQRVVHAAQHLHGGIGVDRDYPLHRYFLAAKQLELLLGGARRQSVRLGALLAG